MNRAFVYYLLDPRDDQIRYVGFSKYPRDRYKYHSLGLDKTHKGTWVRSLHKLNLQPKLKIVCQCSVEFAKEIEISLISKLHSRLTNGTRGGDGLVGASREIRERIRQSCLIAFQDPNVKLRMRESARKARTPEWRAAHSQIMTGRASSLKGKPSPLRGLVRPKEVGDKIRQAFARRRALKKGSSCEL